MATGVRDKYHVAINGRGYMLRGAPERPAYSRSVIASQVERLAISDLAYSDFAGTGLFYIAQTDWSAGIKSEKLWRDDAKFWYSTNIDVYSEQGAIKLEKEVTLDNDFTETITCGGIYTVNDVLGKYVGTMDNGSGYIQVYRNTGGGWSDIAGTSFATSNNSVGAIFGHKNKLYVGAGTGAGNSTVIQSYNGSTWTDLTTLINTASTIVAIKAARCIEELGGILYVMVSEYVTNEYSLVSTVDNGTTWVEELYTASAASPVAMRGYLDDLYYLTFTGSVAELRVFDPATNTNVLVQTFYNVTAPNNYGNENLLRIYKGKLIITLNGSVGKIYEYDGSTITEIFSQDADKAAIGKVGNSYLNKGAVEHNGRLHWGNLIYDGESFYSWKKPISDSDYYLYPLFVNESDLLHMIDTSDESKLYTDGSNYKTTIANNYLIFNEMSQISSIDKLLYSISVIYDALATNQSIRIDYSINGRSTWVTVGTVSYSATDSGTSKTFIIPSTVLFKKIWWKIHLDGTATTPVIRDVVMAYRPMPEYRNRWGLRFNFSDGVKLLNKQHEERTGNDLNSELWNEKLTKQKVLFEDVDYIDCTLVSAMTAANTSAAVSDTKRFPRQGRIRAVSANVAEEMYYTSAESKKLKGLTRGVRGTTARTYISGQIFKNDYDVYVEDITTELNFTDEKKTENIAQVLLIEA